MITDLKQHTNNKLLEEAARIATGADYKAVALRRAIGRLWIIGPLLLRWQDAALKELVDEHNAKAAAKK